MSISINKNAIKLEDVRNVNGRLKTKTPPDVQAALFTWREMNSNPNIWAKFEAAQFENHRVVMVDWGAIHSDGFKERAIETITFTLDRDGEVKVAYTVHS